MPGVLAAQPIAIVGASAVTRHDIDRRIAIEQAYGGTLTREGGLASIVNDLIEREVVRSIGLLPDGAELQTFSDHADQTSKAPEILAAVKRIFGSDSAAYRDIYLAPRLINLKLHDYFNRDTLLQAAARHSVERAYGLAARGEPFAAAAVQTGLRYSIDSLRDRPRGLPAELMRYSGGDSTTHDPYMDLIARMAPGEFFKTIVETDDDYRVVRLLRRDDSLQVVESIVADKGDFDSWFRREASRVHIAIADRRTRSSLIRAYPRLWWVERLRKGKRTSPM
jgi:hypothetical protein